MNTSAKTSEHENSRRAMCGICPAGCWVNVSYDSEGRICEVNPDSDSELGMICKLGKSSPQIVYSPDRLRYPQLRTGPKGTYEFERISWDQAFDIIVGKLQAIKDTYGPEAAAIYTGRGSFELAECDVFQPAGGGGLVGIQCALPVWIAQHLGSWGALLRVICHDCASRNNGRHDDQHVLRPGERGLDRRMGR